MATTSREEHTAGSAGEALIPRAITARIACPRCHRLAPRLSELELLWVDGYTTVVVCDACVAKLRSSPDPMTVVQFVRTIEA